MYNNINSSQMEFNAKLLIYNLNNTHFLQQLIYHKFKNHKLCHILQHQIHVQF